MKELRRDSQARARNKTTDAQIRLIRFRHQSVREVGYGRETGKLFRQQL